MFGLSSIYTKLIIAAIVAIIIGGLLVKIRIDASDLRAAAAQHQADVAQIAQLNDQVTTIDDKNKGLLDQVNGLTFDAQKYEAAAAKAKADLATFTAERDADVSQAQQQIKSVAVASDSVVSPALARLSRIWVSGAAVDGSAAADRPGSAAH